MYDPHLIRRQWEWPLDCGDGPAVARLSSLGGCVSLDEHEHENPYLSVYLTGAYRERSGSTEAVVDRPAMVLHPAGAVHADETGAAGLDALVVELDPDWLNFIVPDFQPQRRSTYWTGPAASRGAAAVSRAWLAPAANSHRALELLAGILRGLPSASRSPAAPPWLSGDLIRTSDSAAAVARRLRRNPASVARTFAAHQGESLREARRRERVGRASRLLRETNLSLAAVAVDCGFCDQAHMTRAFGAIFHRTPADLRRCWTAAGARGPA